MDHRSWTQSPLDVWAKVRTQKGATKDEEDIGDGGAGDHDRDQTHSADRDDQPGDTGGGGEETGGTTEPPPKKSKTGGGLSKPPGGKKGRQGTEAAGSVAAASSSASTPSPSGKTPGTPKPKRGGVAALKSLLQ